MEKKFTIKDAREVARKLGISEEVEDYYSYAQFAYGMNDELEHGKVDSFTDITGDDPILTTKIALAHLRKENNYYFKIMKEEEQKCDINIVF